MLSGLIKALNGDPSGSSIERVLRLPGTHNFKHGRPLQVREIFREQTASRYTIDDFGQWEDLNAKSRRTDAHIELECGSIDLAASFAESGKRRALFAVELLKIADLIKGLIITGSLDGYKSRSERDWAIINALLEADYNLATITAIFTNKFLGCSERILEKGLHFLVEEVERALSKTDHQHEPAASPRIVTLRDFLSMEVQTRDILIDPLLAKNELGILSGPSKLGKSLFAMNMALCLACGRNWLDFQIRRAAKVSLIQQEVAAAPLTERLRRMLRGNGVSGVDNALDNIAINSTRGILLDTDTGLNEIRRAIESYCPDTLILDPLVSFHTKNENSAEEMAEVFRIIHKLIDEYNIALFLIHHFGKPSQLEREGGELHRGSSVIGSSSDSNWTFKRVPQNKYRIDRPRSEYAELSFELRNAESPNPIVLHRNPETLWYERASLEENRRVTPEMIRDIVQEHGGRVKQDGVLRTLRHLVSDRLIKEAIYEAERRDYIGSRRIRGRGNPKELFFRDLQR